LPLVTSQHKHQSCEDNVKMCGAADCQLWTVYLQFGALSLRANVGPLLAW